jgi:VanZ family protein
MARYRLYAPLGYTAFLYGTLPFVRRATDALRAQNMLRATIITLCLGAAAVGFALLVRRLRVPPARAAALITAFSAIYAGIYVYIPQPEEFGHFIEYGALPLVWLWALQGRLRGPGLYLTAATLSAITGLGDELIQGQLPARYFEWRDVGLNVVASLLGMAARVAASNLSRTK